MKPKVICHIMGSIDGRILVDRWSSPCGGASLADYTGVYRQTCELLHTDAWTFGKNTICEIFPEKFQNVGVQDGQSATSIYRGNLQSPRKFLSIDPEADIKYGSNTLRGDDIIAVVDRRATSEYLKFLQSLGITYAVVEDIGNLSDVLEMLNREFGIECISLQGGGVLNGGMLSQGVIDELSYVMYPGIDGTADSVSIFNYIGSQGESPAANVSAELLSVKEMCGGAVWLRYRLHQL